MPFKDDCFEMTLPQAFFDSNPNSVTLNWIDFYWYRGSLITFFSGCSSQTGFSVRFFAVTRFRWRLCPVSVPGC